MCSLCVHLMADGWAEGGSCGFPAQRGAFRSHQPAAPASTFRLTLRGQSPATSHAGKRVARCGGREGGELGALGSLSPLRALGPLLSAQEESSLPKAGLGSQRPSAS